MLSPPSTDSATKEQSGSDSCSAKPIKEVKNLNCPDAKISCPCRSSLSTESMIQVCTFALIRTIYKCFSQYCLFHSLIFFSASVCMNAGPFQYSLKIAFKLL